MIESRFRVSRAAGNNDVSGACGQEPGRDSGMRRRPSGKSTETMRLCRKAAARSLIALAGSAALLGGCRADSTLEFKADGSVRTEIVFEDDTDSMRTLKGNCDDLKIAIPVSLEFLDGAKIDNITKPGGVFTCKATSNTPINSIYGISLRKLGNSYSLTYEPLKTGRRIPIKTAQTTIIMPGKVLKTNTGTIHGNKVVIDGTGYLTDGFQITSEANGTSSSPSRSDSAKKGLPLWMWALIGTGALTAIVGASAFSVRKENEDSSRVDAGFD